jgi:hypothetical protein
MSEQSSQVAGARFSSSQPPPPPPPPTLIRFGDRPSQTVPAEWAEGILRQAFTEKPTWFKKWFAEAATANGNGPGR